MSLPPRFLDDLRARLPLSEVVGTRVKVTRAGREFKACCPFHKEKTPSFYINDDKQFFHCFGCGAHGDVLGFTMRHDNLSFIEAVEQLAARAGLQMPTQRPEDIERAKTEKSLYALMEVATAWFETQLNTHDNRAVVAYLTGRGLTPETIAGFRLGFAPSQSDGLIAHLKGQGFTLEQMTTMGLLKIRERDGTPYPFFRERVMFPVADRGGRVIAFGGRVLPDHLRVPDRSDFKPPKYLNSPETPLFYKGQTVYALARARQAAHDGQPIVVVEGYMDVIALHQVGLTGTVAPLGTALTEEQMALLWRLIPGAEKVITLCFDGDEAGLRAAARAADRMLPLLKPDHSARLAFMPAGEDPDTLVLNQGGEAMRAILDRAVPLADYIWNLHSAARALNTPEDRAGFEAEIDALLNRITDPKTKYHYQQYFRRRMAERFRPPGASVGGQSVAAPFAPRGQRFAGAVPPVRPTARPTALQLRMYDILLATLLNHPALFAQIDEDLGTLNIPDAPTESLRQALFDSLAEVTGAPVDRSTLHTRLRSINPDFNRVIDRLIGESVLIHARFARPEAEEGDALAGWREVYANLARATALRA